MRIMPYDPLAPKRMTQRNLPHWAQTGTTTFLTFRLADAVPSAVLAKWRQEQAAWLLAHPEPLTPLEERQFLTIFNRRRQAYLDAGHGACLLARPAIATVVADALHRFAGVRYGLGPYVVMPNHVHVVVTPRPETSVEHVVHSWKSYTSKEINRLIGQTGRVWQAEAYDHLVRSPRQFRHYTDYIRENPQKAQLAPGTYRLYLPDDQESNAGPGQAG